MLIKDDQLIEFLQKNIQCVFTIKHFLLFERTVFIKSEIKLNLITLIVTSFVTVYSIVRNQAKYQKYALGFSLESTKLSCYLWKLFNQTDSIQFPQVMYLNLNGLMARYLNGYLGSILSQDYVMLSNCFYLFSMLYQSFYKQFLFYDKHKYSSNTATIFLKWKKINQITIRGYKWQIILDSDFMVFTIFQLALS